MKFICIGKNYADHAAEMASAVPTSPLIFMKPSTALLPNGRSFYMPDFSQDIHYEAELIFRISKTAKGIAATDAFDFIDSVSLGIDFTARDLQADCKKKGYPWEIAKSFDYSAVVGEWQPFNIDMLSTAEFTLEINHNKVQHGHAKNMIFDVPYLLHYISQRFTLEKGDILFTGTPSGVGQVKKGDVLKAALNDNQVLICDIK